MWGLLCVLALQGWSVGGGGWSAEARSSKEPGREVLKDALALEKGAELQPWGGVQGSR